jgi:hypothetical protein
MKKLLTVIFALTSAIGYAQTTINPDTVCLNATGQQYFVTNTASSTYQWTITGAGGALQSGQGTNAITVNWGGVPGLYPNAVKVVETNATNCSGTPVLLNVFVLSLSGTAIGPFCVGAASTPLVGTPSGGTWSGTGVVANTFSSVTAGLGTHVLTYTRSGCTTTINVIVNAGPITGPIQHY